jgi:hypothetical protein
MRHVQGEESHVASIHELDGTMLGKLHVERMNIVQLGAGFVDHKEPGMLPRRSSSVCTFTGAALVERKCAHGNTGRSEIDGHRVD